MPLSTSGDLVSRENCAFLPFSPINMAHIIDQATQMDWGTGVKDWLRGESK